MLCLMIYPHTRGFSSTWSIPELNPEGESPAQQLWHTEITQHPRPSAPGAYKCQIILGKRRFPVKHQPAAVLNEDFLEKQHKLQEGTGVALPCSGRGHHGFGDSQTLQHPENSTDTHRDTVLGITWGGREAASHLGSFLGCCHIPGMMLCARAHFIKWLHLM